MNMVVETLPKRWLSNKEACRYLGVSDEFMKGVRERAEIHFYKHGKTVWYDVADIDKYIKKGQVV